MFFQNFQLNFQSPHLKIDPYSLITVAVIIFCLQVSFIASTFWLSQRACFGFNAKDTVAIMFTATHKVRIFFWHRFNPFSVADARNPNAENHLQRFRSFELIVNPAALLPPDSDSSRRMFGAFRSEVDDFQTSASRPRHLTTNAFTILRPSSVAVLVS